MKTIVALLVAAVALWVASGLLFSHSAIPPKPRHSEQGSDTSDGSCAFRRANFGMCSSSRQSI